MSRKNIYLFKVVIQDTQTNTEVPVSTFKALFDGIFSQQARNNAVKLSFDDVEPIMLDILDNTDEYLFARLSRKRPNNGLQKRDYTTYLTGEVLSPEELERTGVELFTYCILGYSHGILSLINSKGAPGTNAFAQMFQHYNNRFSLETQSIPNQKLINELLEGKSPEINRVQVEIAQPDAQILQELFGFTDKEVLQAVNHNTSAITFEIKPDFRGALSTDKDIIRQLVGLLQKNHDRYNSVVLSGKKASGERQRQYDLYEEYFRYPIEVNEYRQEGGRKVERQKDKILRDYRNGMMNVYNEYKEIILTISNRCTVDVC